MPQLPSGSLFWRLETFANRAEAEKAAAPFSGIGETTLLNAAAGKTWSATIGPAGMRSPGATFVAKVGPLPAVPSRGQYLLNFGSQLIDPGGFVDTHTHAGVESFYVLAGDLSLRTATCVTRVAAGKSVIVPRDTAMRPSNEGTVAIQMFPFVLLDDRPTTALAQFPAASSASPCP